MHDFQITNPAYVDLHRSVNTYIRRENISEWIKSEDISKWIRVGAFSDQSSVIRQFV